MTTPTVLAPLDAQGLARMRIESKPRDPSIDHMAPVLEEIALARAERDLTKRDEIVGAALGSLANEWTDIPAVDAHLAAERAVEIALNLRPIDDVQRKDI